MSRFIYKKTLILLAFITLFASPVRCLAAVKEVGASKVMNLSNGWRVDSDGVLTSEKGEQYSLDSLIGNKDIGKQELMAALEKAYVENSEWGSVISRHEWDELQMEILIDKCNRTKTIFGRHALKKLIKQQKNLKSSQAFVKQLVNNPELYDAVENLLEGIKSGQNDFASYWNPAEDLHFRAQNLYFNLFFFKKYFNKKKSFLEGMYFFEMLRSTTMTLSLIGVAQVVQSYAHHLTLRGKKKAFNVMESLKNTFGFLNPFGTDMYKKGDYLEVKRFTDKKTNKKFTQYYDGSEHVWSLGSAGDVGYLAHDFFKYIMPGSGLMKGFVRGSLATLVSGARSFGIGYNISEQLKGLQGQLTGHVLTANELQYSFISIAQCMRSLKKLEIFTSNGNGGDSAHDGLLSGISEFLSRVKQGPLAEFMSLMDATTFDEASSIVYSRGKVLRAHKLMQQIKDQFIPLFKHIAELDTFYSIATLYKERVGKDGAWSFVDFVENDKPLLVLKDAWTPLLSPDKAVLNSVELGGLNNANNIVLTGPNGGGKSTTMFTMSQAIVLGQSWGIAPARSAKMTIFNKVITGLNPKADIEKDISTFMAEKMVVDNMLAAMKASKADQFIFACLDEPMHGTVNSEGNKRVYKIGKKVALYPQCCLVMATHLKKPAELNKDTNGAFENYQLGHEEIRSSGGFKRTYKLIKGYASWWFEDADQVSRFTNWLGTPKSI
jgi:hypothetical protein